MGFPVNYQYEGKHNIKHKQVGNAVCVQLSRATAKAKKDNLNICKIRQRDNIKLVVNKLLHYLTILSKIQKR